MVVTRKPASLTRIYAWFSAALNDDRILLEDLLAHGVPIDVLHPLRHSTALMEATRLGRTELVQWLLERGAAPAFLCGQPLGTALHCALRRRYWNIAHILAQHMDSCAVLDGYGATPLHILCSEDLGTFEIKTAVDLALLLIQKSCPLNALDQEGTTALHHCVINDLRELAHVLLSHDANPNALIPDSLVSPLMIAALEKNPDMARLLIAHGANPNLETRDGSTPVSAYPIIAELVTNDASPGMMPFIAPARDKEMMN